MTDYFCKSCGEKICTLLSGRLMEIQSGEKVAFARKSDWIVCSCGESYRASEIRKELSVNKKNTKEG